MAKDIADLKAMFGSLRTESKAKLIGNPRSGGREAQAGAFIGALMGLKSGDPEQYAASKATLIELGSQWADVPAESKATLGETNAAGGWILPNALVDDLIKPAGYTDPFGAICTDVPGITVGSVDIPVRNSRPARATVQPFGQTKENLDLTYDGYTATIYTLARIYDLGLQFARRSAGAAERDVVEELGTAFQLGTEYYTVSGSGSSEPYGLVTALTAGTGTPFTSSFSASATTLAGSILKAIATAGGALAGRGRGRDLSAVLNAAQYWLLASQGTDNAGFFYSGINGAAAIPNVAQGTMVTPFGVPVIPDDSFPTDDLVVGQFRALKRYFGQTYRVDSSTQAGERWDKNLIGFRGEMEFGMDARPAVIAGAFQYVADILP
jgi:HK97 family phage major capsid protein